MISPSENRVIRSSLLVLDHQIFLSRKVALSSSLNKFSRFIANSNLPVNNEADELRLDLFFFANHNNVKTKFSVSQQKLPFWFVAISY